MHRFELLNELERNEPMPTEIGQTDSKHDDLRSLRIDHSLRDGGGEPPAWSRRFILGGIAVVVLLGIAALAYRLLGSETPEVEVVRATAEGSDAAGSTVLSASGYIVAHHKISVNSKVTGRVAWIGVEKGDKVKEGQVLVRLEDEEFRAQYEQARGAVESAKARLLEQQNGSRPEEIQQADHNLSEARATAVNDKINLDRTRDLVAQGVHVQAESGRRHRQERRFAATNEFAGARFQAHAARPALRRD